MGKVTYSAGSMNRRSFLIALGMLPAVLGCQRSRAAAPSDASRVAAETVVMDVAIPRLLFFPECRARSGPSHCTQGRVRVTAMRRDIGGDDHVEVVCDNRQTLAFPAGTSFAALAAAHQGRARRDGVMLKSLVAWTLDSLWQNVRRTGASRDLQAAFSELQRQRVLESVTPASLFRLFKELQTRSRPITDVHWAPEQASFVLR